MDSGLEWNSISTDERFMRRHLDNVDRDKQRRNEAIRKVVAAGVKSGAAVGAAALLGYGAMKGVKYLRNRYKKYKGRGVYTYKSRKGYMKHEDWIAILAAVQRDLVREGRVRDGDIWQPNVVEVVNPGEMATIKRYYVPRLNDIYDEDYYEDHGDGRLRLNRRDLRRDLRQIYRNSIYNMNREYHGSFGVVKGSSDDKIGPIILGGGPLANLVRAKILIEANRRHYLHNLKEYLNASNEEVFVNNAEEEYKMKHADKEMKVYSQMRNAGSQSKLISRGGWKDPNQVFDVGPKTRDLFNMIKRRKNASKIISRAVFNFLKEREKRKQREMARRAAAPVSVRGLVSPERFGKRKDGSKKNLKGVIRSKRVEKRKSDEELFDLTKIVMEDIMNSPTPIAESPEDLYEYLVERFPDEGTEYMVLSDGTGEKRRRDDGDGREVYLNRVVADINEAIDKPKYLMDILASTNPTRGNDAEIEYRNYVKYKFQQLPDYGVYGDLKADLLKYYNDSKDAEARKNMSSSKALMYDMHKELSERDKDDWIRHDVIRKHRTLELQLSPSEVSEDRYLTQTSQESQRYKSPMKYHGKKTRREDGPSNKRIREEIEMEDGKFFDWLHADDYEAQDLMSQELRENQDRWYREHMDKLLAEGDGGRRAINFYDEVLEGRNLKGRKVLYDDDVTDYREDSQGVLINPDVDPSSSAYHVNYRIDELD